MAKKTIMVSDLSGKEIDGNGGAVVTIKFSDGRRGTFVLDITADEADQWATKGRKIANRGRPPRVATA